jgi:hypothetical protein
MQRSKSLFFIFQIASVILLGLVATASSAAESIDNFVENIKISGKLRMYDFTRNYATPNLPQQTAFALGGNINLLTPDLYFKGLQADVDFYTAHTLLGLNSSNPALVDRTLGESINVLGQAYLQYGYHDFLVKAGRQIIDTPWINPSDSRMIPNSYQGVYVSYQPIKSVKLTALRLFEFKDRISDSFSDINLYNPEAMGDVIPKLADVRDRGAAAIGGEYKNKNLDSQLWYYQFYDFSKLVYADGEYDFTPCSAITPFVGAQVLRETADGRNYIAHFTGDSVDSSAYGLLLGVKNNYFKLSMGYNRIFEDNSSFKHGDIISPYTAGYATDPLYTTSMIAGLVEKGAGDAIKASGSLFLLDKKLTLTGSYAKYFVPNNNNTQEINGDVKYSFDGKLKGFSVRDRVGVLYNDVRLGRFIYNRVMLEYAF